MKSKAQQQYYTLWHRKADNKHLVFQTKKGGERLLAS